MRKLYPMIRWGDRLASARILLIVVLIAFVGLILMLILGGASGPVAPGLIAAGYLIAPVIIVIQFIPFGVSRLGFARMKKQVLAARGHMCPACAYDLTARAPTDHTCPECGLVCPRRECVRLWCKLLRSRL